MDIKISELPAGVATPDAVVPATNAEDTLTEKITLGDIAGLVGAESQGIQGTQGTTGIQGPIGLQGTTGAQGTIGIQGSTVLDGSSFSNPSGINGATAITNIVAISQANYDQLSTKNSTTLHVIT